MDDEAVVRKVIGSMLTSLGYTVELKNDGKTAVAFFMAEYNANHPVTAVVLDLTVPGGMGGKEVVSEIRKVDKDVPVFAVSGYENDSVMKNPAGYGFTASICKPFKRVELMKVLETHLGKK